MKQIKRLLIIFAVVYVIALFLVYVFQRNFIYFPTGQSTPPGFEEFAGVETVAVDVDGVGHVSSFYKEPSVDRPVVLFFHGNGGEAFHRIPQAKSFQEWDVGFLMAEYPGYGGNPGTASEVSFLPSALAHYDWLLDQGIDPQRIVIYGHSLGAASAVYVASERDADLLVLSAPFLSAKAMGRHRMPYFPTGILLKDLFRSDLRMPAIEEPLRVFHGEDDKIIPMQMGEALTALHGGDRQFVRIENGGHNNLWTSEMPGLVRAEIIHFNNH